MDKNITYWAADTENTVPRSDLYQQELFDEDDYMSVFAETYEEEVKENGTHVWAAGIAPVSESVTEDDVVVSDSIEAFLKGVQKLDGRPVIYFHNLAYDGKFIMYYLLQNGYSETMNSRPATVSEMEQIDKIVSEYGISAGELLETIVPPKYKGRAQEQSEYDEYFRGCCLEDYNSICSGKDVLFADFSRAWEFVVNIKRRMKVRDPGNHEFAVCVSGEGVWYSLKVRFPHSHKVVEFRDSLKLLPFSVEKIAKDLKTRAQKLVGSIDYTIDRPVGWVITDTEMKYIKNDILVMAEALAMIKPMGLLDNLTIGSACMHDFTTRFGDGDFKEGKKKFRSSGYFPLLDNAIDKKIRKSYHGGWCFNNTDGHIYECRGYVYDVNSLYPSVMFGHYYPVGNPVQFNGDDFDKFKGNAYFIRVRVSFTVKKDHLPFIQIKHNRWADNEYIRDSEGIVELTFTRPDWELFNEQYDIDYLDIIEGWAFDSVKGLFDDYISYWYDLKKNAPNPVIRLICKLMLNNLYGKFATSPCRSEAHFALVDGVLHAGTAAVEGDSVFIPVGAFITAYARGVTIRAAQNNYSNFLYSDTDSIHLSAPAKGIPVSKELGEWDNESCWIKARFVRQKTYIEYTDIADGKNVDPFLLIRACGASDAVKERLQYKVTWEKDGKSYFKPIERDENDKIINEKRSVDEVIERFTFGLVEAGKLAKKTVEGGCILHETLFSIRG